MHQRYKYSITVNFYEPVCLREFQLEKGMNMENCITYLRRNKRRIKWHKHNENQRSVGRKKTNAFLNARRRTQILDYTQILSFSALLLFVFVCNFELAMFFYRDNVTRI